MKLGKKIKYIIIPVLVLLSSFVSSVYYDTYKQQIIKNKLASLDGRIENLLLRAKYQFDYSKDYIRQKIDSKEASLIFNTIERGTTLPPSYIGQFMNRFIDKSSGEGNVSDIVNDFAIYKNNKKLVVHINTQDPFARSILKKKTQQILTAAKANNKQKISQYYYFTESSQDKQLTAFYLIQMFSPYQLTSDRSYHQGDSLYFAQAEINIDYIKAELDSLIENNQGYLSYSLVSNNSQSSNLTFSSTALVRNINGMYQGGFSSELFDVRVSLDKAYFSDQLTNTLINIAWLNIFIITLSYLLLVWLINKQIIKPITSLAVSIKAVEASAISELQPLTSNDEVAELNESYISLINKVNLLANNDALTGLANRASFNKELAIVDCNRQSSDNYTVIIFVDLDNFKYVNDNFGHDMGDRLLVAFSQRLTQTLRAADRFSVTDSITSVARLGGDEFVVLINSLPSIAAIESIGQRICDLFKDGFIVDDNKLDVHASIGIAFAKAPINNAETLLSQADNAMYLAKNAGKNNFKLYGDEIKEKINFEKNIEKELERRLHNDDFELVFMPAYSTSTLELEGYELLLHSFKLSDLNIGPDTFIVIAEKSDLILQIDLWVAEQALILLKEITQAHGFKGFFSINLSAKSLRDERFYLHLKKLINNSPIAHQLELEITETCLLPDDHKAIASLNQLKSLGLRIALDNFGTGYTSFRQLVDYPLDTLKIDRSFVNEIHNTAAGKKPTLDIIFQLAKFYQLDVIVEGIETQADFEYVKSLGCDLVQGNYFTKPMPWSKVIAVKTQAPKKEALALKVQREFPSA